MELALCGDIHPHPGQTTDSDSCASHHAKQANNNLRCFSFNAQSLCSVNKSTDGLFVSNLQSFQDLAFLENLDIITVTETWLNDNISNNEIFPTGYNVIRKDRSSGKRGGGVLIALLNNINYNLVSLGAWSNELEIAAVEIELNNTKKSLICACYRPPNVDRFGRPLGDFWRVFRHCRKCHSYNAKISRRLQIFVFFVFFQLFSIRKRKHSNQIDIYLTSTVS